MILIKARRRDGNGCAEMSLARLNCSLLQNSCHNGIVMRMVLGRDDNVDVPEALITREGEGDTCGQGSTEHTHCSACRYDRASCALECHHDTATQLGWEHCSRR